MNKYSFLHWLKCIAAVMLLLIMTGSPAVMQARSFKTLPATPGALLQNDVIYTVDNDMTITGEKTAGLAVAAGGTVTIYIPSGVTLTVKGADADGSQGAFAGIMVPSNSTLILTGQGRLIAQGGKIGPGQKGGDGGDGKVETDTEYAQGGKGGDGGAGGGGAAPGIGGNGGDGADPVIGPTCERKFTDKDKVDGPGNDGGDARLGGMGNTMGRVYVLGSVMVQARYGGTEAEAAQPGANGKNGEHKWHNYYTAGGGGAGGGGGSGFAAPYGIGAGGCGGQSGAAGGSGGRYSRSSYFDYNHGGSGAGGHGCVEGLRQKDERTSAGGMAGGAGGTATMPAVTAGGNGTLYASQNANLVIDGNRRADHQTETHDALAVTVTFNANAADAKLGSKTATLYFGTKPQKIDIPTRTGYFFTGYFTKEGEIIYDTNGRGACYNTIREECTLYAQWSNTHISTVAQFEAMSRDIANGVTTEGATYYLDNDLDLGNSQAMLGTDIHPFEGTFDGQGHTIKINYKAAAANASYTALFAYIREATIQNLNTAGSISGKHQQIGGIVGKATSGILYKCTSEVSIAPESALTGGGLVASCDYGPLYMHNCAFTGELSAANILKGGGLIGDMKASGTIESCYVDDVSMRNESGNNNFSPITISTNENKNLNINYTYYHKALKDKKWASDRGIALNEEDFQSGKLCYELNQEKVNGRWYQSIGEDRIPCLNSSHRKVFYDYSATSGELIYHNRNYVELKAGQTFLTGYKPKVGVQVYELLQFKGQEEPGEVQYTDQAYTYLYYKDSVSVEDIPSGKIDYYFYNIGNEELAVKSEGRLYELAIMENGVIVHHFMPSRYRRAVGFYDIIEHKFIAVDGAEAFIDTEVMPCQHKYSVDERSYGMQGTHCYLCDQTVNPQYYVYAQFDGQGATGNMGGQTLETGDELKLNQFYKKVQLFDGWKVYDRNGKQVGKSLYADGEQLVINQDFCDTLTFRAQWVNAFVCNGEKKRISSENIRQIDIMDDNVNGFATAAPFTAGAISYTRTLPAQQRWGSLCLPFAITGDDNTLLFTTGSISRDANNRETITLVKAEGNKVAAGVPCMFYDKRTDVSSERKLHFSATNAKVVAEAGVTTANGLTFNGTFEGDAFKCDTQRYAYYGVMGDTFYNVGTSYVVYPYHMFMTMPRSAGGKAAERYYIDLDAEATGIREIHGTDFTESEQNAYDLTGSSVETISRPGIYIVNGKKILVK